MWTVHKEQGLGVTKFAPVPHTEASQKQLRKTGAWACDLCSNTGLTLAWEVNGVDISFALEGRLDHSTNQQNLIRVYEHVVTHNHYVLILLLSFGSHLWAKARQSDFSRSSHRIQLQRQDVDQTPQHFVAYLERKEPQGF